MSAKMQAMLTKVPQTLGDSYFVLDLVTGNPRQKNGKERLMAQPAKRRTLETGKTTPPTQGSKAGKPKKQVSALQKKNPTDKQQGKKTNSLKSLRSPFFMFVTLIHPPEVRFVLMALPPPPKHPIPRCRIPGCLDCHVIHPLVVFGMSIRKSK
jgi:hypothetical protein